MFVRAWCEPDAAYLPGETSMKTLFNLALAALVTGFVLPIEQHAVAQGNACPQGLKGTYAVWSKGSATTGLGSFTTPVNQVAVLPGFTWNVTGMPLSVAVGTNEPFGGGNSMQDIYGPATTATNLNIRIKPNDVSPGNPIPHSALLTIQFNSTTPSSGWGFAVVDMDVDQVRFRAKDASGVDVPTSTLASWFVQRFDADPVTDGINLPSWDNQMAAVVGSESSSTTWRDTVEGGLDDTEAGSAWFQPNIALSEITFEYESLQESANPSYHVFVAACSANIATPTPSPSATPTPSPSVTPTATSAVTPTRTPSTNQDSDGDTIPDATEGDADPDNDEIPNYLDKDSDDDTIPDSTEGTKDTDGDGKPDYVDRDSDGDDVADQIERDPDATTDSSTGQDQDRDGIDDGNEEKTNTPADDSDGDSIPNHLDQDSDNDGEGDGEEAYDLDGDGTRDVTPSGKDKNNDGLDDAFENFDTAQEVNPRFSGKPNNPVCRSINCKRIKKGVSTRLLALAQRVPMFSKRARACGGAVPLDLSTSTQTILSGMERRLHANFPDRSLICPESMCTVVPSGQTRTALLTLAKQLYRNAKTAKLLAIKACGAPANHSGKKRPTTETYLAQLRSEIAKLPRKLSACPGTLED